MHPELTIYLYGHYDSMFYILNGIALIVNSSFMDSLISLMVSIGLLYHGINLVYSSAEGRHRVHLQRIMVMALMVATIITQKGDIWVKDRVSGKMDKVSNLPLAFTMPVGILESFGTAITSGFEQAFTPVGSLSFREYGMIFGSRLVAESRNWKIANPEFANNMDNFIKRCVVTEAMIGNRLTPQDIIDSDDLLALITERAGTFRQVEFTQGRRKYRYNCAEAVSQLQTYLTSELEILGRRYLNSDFSLAGLDSIGITGASGTTGTSPLSSAASILNSQLKSNIELAYGSVLGSHMSAEQIIQQNMMINAIHDYTNKADLYGYTRASMQQESSWMLSSMLAAEYLPIALTVLKGLIYGSFIFVLPLMIIGGGIKRYQTYLQLVFSMQLWAPLSAILNLFIELYSSNTGNGITGGVLTYASFNSAHMAVDKIVAVASGLQWSIPLLSYSIVQGAVTGFVHLASSLGGTSQSAASVAAGELTTGSRNLDNVSIGNMQRAQQIAHKTDLNSSFATGASSYQHADGMVQTTRADGESFYTSNNFSSGSVKVNGAQAWMNEHRKAFDEQESMMESNKVSYDEAKTATITNAANYLEQIMDKEFKGKKVNFESAGEQGEALQKMIAYAKDKHKSGEYTWAQAAQAAATAYADGGVNSIIPGIKSEAGVKIEGSIEASNTNNQSLSDSERTSRSQDTNENFNNLVRAISNEDWTKEMGLDSSYAKDAKASFDKMQSYSEQISLNRDTMQTHSDAISRIENNSGNMEMDFYDDLADQIVVDYNLGSKQDAVRMIEGHDSRINKSFEKVVDSKFKNLTSEIEQGKQSVSDGEFNQRKTDFENEHATKVNDKGLDQVKKQAEEKGLNEEAAREEINQTQERLNSKHKKMIDENEKKYNDAEKTNVAKENEFQKSADKYEKNRISKYLGIGGPGAAQEMLDNFQKNPKGGVKIKK